MKEYCLRLPFTFQRKNECGAEKSALLPIRVIGYYFVNLTRKIANIGKVHIQFRITARLHLDRIDSKMGVKIILTNVNAT